MAEFSWVKSYAPQADTFPDELLRVASHTEVIAPSSVALLMEVHSILIGETAPTNVPSLIDACVERGRVSNTIRTHFQDAVKALESFDE